MDIDEDIQDFLEHHGVKGQKWGVRKERETSSGDAGSKTTKPVVLSEQEKAVVKKLAPHGYTEERMRKMYGPGSPGSSPDGKKEGFKLTEGQKEALKIGAGVGVAVIGIYALGKYAEKKQTDMLLGEGSPDSMRKFWNETQNLKGAAGRGLSKADVSKLSTEPVHLSAGSILKRVSTMKETSINEKGFYAAYKDDDVGRYKAVLPVYWKLWGHNAKEGHVVNLRAKTDINAPSPRKTFDMFVDFLGGSDPSSGRKNRDEHAVWLPNFGRGGNDETFARSAFHAVAGNWNDNDNPLTKSFFDHVKGQGFNALTDFNDAGNLADSPLRLLDGKMFEVAGHELLTATDISNAQKTVLELVHAIGELIFAMFNNMKNRSDEKTIANFLDDYFKRNRQEVT